MTTSAILWKKIFFLGSLLFLSGFLSAQVHLNQFTEMGSPLFNINNQGQGVLGNGYYDFETNTLSDSEDGVGDTKAITNEGLVLGTFQNDAGAYVPALKENGTWSLLPSSAFDPSEDFTLYDVSENGIYVVGQTGFVPGQGAWGFLYNTQTETMTILSGSAYNNGAAYGVNNAGIAVGWVQDPSTNSRKPAYFSTDGTITLIGDSAGEAEEINNDNKVVGFVGDQAFIYSIDEDQLATFDAPEGYESTAFSDISGTGVVTGFAQNFVPGVGQSRDPILYQATLGDSITLLVDFLDSHNVDYDENSFDGQGYRISTNGKYIAGWTSGPAMFATGWALYLDDVFENNDTTSYCTPEFSSGCDLGDMIDDFTLIGENGTSIEDESTGCSANAYDDRTNESVDLTPSHTYTADIVSESGPDYAVIWIDFNNNGQFENSERVGYSTGPVSINSDAGGFQEGAGITMQIPLSAAQGEHRMRVMLAWDVTDPDDFTPCNDPSASNYGEVHDYTVNILATPACPNPSDLALENVSSHTADISWTPGNDESEWQVVYGPSGFTPGDSLSTTLSPNPTAPEATISGLNDNTAYDVYIKAVCSETSESQWVGPRSFMTHCDAVNVPFTQDFENITPPTLPNCGKLQTLSGNSWKTANISTNGFDSNVLEYPFSLTEDADSWYFTRGINLQAGVDYQISYHYGNNSNAWNEKLKVAFGDAAEETAMTNVLANYDSINQGQAQHDIIIFNVDSSGVYYFGFNAHSDAGEWFLFVDDIAIIEAPDCPQPTELTASNITAHTADLSWTPGADEEQWEIVYGPAGFNPDTVSQETLVANPSYTLEGLLADTTYEVYVRAKCSDNDYSEWTSTSFTSKIESAYCIPEVTTNVEPITSVTFAGIDNQSDPDSEQAYEDFSDQVGNVTPGETYTITLKGNTEGFWTDSFTVFIDFNDNDTLNDPGEVFTIGQIADSDGTDTIAVTGQIHIPETVSPGNIRMRVTKTYDDTPITDPCADLAFGQVEDYTLHVEALDECSEVEAGDPGDDFSVCREKAFTLEAVGASAPAVGLNRIWQSSPAGQNEWTSISGATANPYTVEDGIDQTTDFRFVVTCTATGVTDTSAVVTVSLNPIDECYCIPQYTTGCSLGDQITNVSLQGETIDLDHQSTCSNQGYGDFTDIPGINIPDLAQGESYSLSVSTDYDVPSTEYLSVWIDFNRNGSFEDDEEIAHTASGIDNSGTSTFDFSVPMGLETGNYRMRVRMIYSGHDDITPCGEADWGETEDYQVEITEPLSVRNQVFENFTYYPNPAKNRLNLQAGASIEQVTLFNLLGQQIIQTQPDALQTQIDLTNLQSGVYLMKVSINKTTKTFRIVKQ